MKGMGLLHGREVWLAIRHPSCLISGNLAVGFLTFSAPFHVSQGQGDKCISLVLRTLIDCYGLCGVLLA